MKTDWALRILKARKTLADLKPGDTFVRDCKNPQALYLVVDYTESCLMRRTTLNRIRRLRREGQFQIVDLTNNRVLAPYHFERDTLVRLADASVFVNEIED